MFGWWFGRKHHKHEDRRWDVWRERWRQGRGWFGITSVPLNFLAFYHAQSLTNIVFLQVPLYVVANDVQSSGVGIVRTGAALLWLVGFAIENAADIQLTQWKLAHRKDAVVGVCDRGLWARSRHPNYFGEWLLWLAYALFALPSAPASPWLVVALLAAVPLVAYYFLVHFTGAWMCEQASLQKSELRRVVYACC